MTEFDVDIEKLLNVVEEKTKKQGYVYPGADFITSIPEEWKMFEVEISDKPMDWLLNKLSTFTSLLSSASVDEARYLAKVAALQRELEIVKADVFTHSNAERVREKEKQRDSNPEVIKLQEKLTVADVFLRRYTALRVSYEKFVFLYSRALTVQGEERKLG